MAVTETHGQRTIRGPSRRAFLAGTLAVMQVTMISRLSLAQMVAPLPALTGTALGTDDFLALSARLTGHDELDRSTAEAMLALFQEDGRVKRLGALYDALADGANEAAAMSQVLERANVMEIALDVMRGWYLGIVRDHAGKDRAIAYETTLMGSVVGDFTPIRSICENDYGFWKDPPILADLPLERGSGS
jgi:hypothetical protein